MAGIGKVGVIGAGVMGGGIAAHVANSGTPVVLLDIVAERRGRAQRPERGRDRPHAEDAAPPRSWKRRRRR